MRYKWHIISWKTRNSEKDIQNLEKIKNVEMSER